jgi:flagellar protein FlbD
MIRLTRLSGAPFVLNSDLIERIDKTPDTVITLGDGTKYVAAEDIDTVVTAVRLHRAEIIALSEVLRVTVAESVEASIEPRPAPAQVPAEDAPHLASVTDLRAQGGGEL